MGAQKSMVYGQMTRFRLVWIEPQPFRHSRAPTRESHNYYAIQKNNVICTDFKCYSLFNNTLNLLRSSDLRPRMT